MLISPKAFVHIIIVVIVIRVFEIIFRSGSDFSSEQTITVSGIVPNQFEITGSSAPT